MTDAPVPDAPMTDMPVTNAGERGDGSDAGPGWSVELTQAVVQVLDDLGRPAGTGFLVGERLLVTCAHVLAGAAGAAGAAPTDAAPTAVVSVRFAHLDDTPRRALVDPACWRGPGDGDTTFLRLLDPPPVLARPLPLGTAHGIRQHPVKTFGFPANAPGTGHYGYGVAGDLVRGDGGDPLLQLTDCTEVTEGFSGGPVLDERTGLVIGMVDSVSPPDRHGRGRSTAYVTPTETLRAVHPGLSTSATCPYLGLRAFTTAEAAWFHGRDRAVGAVLASLRRDRGLLALLGPSGSGKSSLVAAGVRPALDRAGLPGSDRWGWITARPGGDPYVQLAQAGLPGAEPGLVAAVRRWLAEHPEFERLVLVLDQFEEILVATPPEPRALLLGQLVDLYEREPAATVVVTLRDDFYSRLAAAAPMLMPLVGRGLVNVPAVLEPGDLADIIQRPALAAGLTLEPNLTERITDDAARVTGPVGVTGGGAPVTVLPLLSSALVELWRRREDSRLTHRAYDQIGGVVGWLGRWCDRAYAEACGTLTADQRPLVRQVVTALVRPGDETTNIPPTRQRRTLDQLRTAETQAGIDPGGEPGVTAVVGALADRRLVTTGRDPATGGPVIELAHEALIHEWGLLRRWLAEDHEFLSWRRDLEADHAQWRASAATRAVPDSELLLHGSALEAARQWLARRPGELAVDLVEFIRLSDAAEARRLTRDRRRVVLLAALLALAVLLGSFAWLQAGRASDQAARAREQARLADSRRLAAQATSTTGRQPDLSLLLALEGLRTAPSREVWGSLGTMLSRPVARSRVLYGHRTQVESVAFSPDGKLLATADFGGRLWFWDPATSRPVGTPFGSGVSGSGASRTLSPYQDVAFDPAGRLLATSNFDDGIQLWDVATRRPVGNRLAPSPGFLGSVAFNPGGTLLVGTIGAKIQLWDVATRRPAGAPVDTRSGNLTDVAFSPDGRTLVTASEAGIVRLWDIATHRKLDEFTITQGVSAVAFSPDGRTLAVGGEQGVLHLVEVDGRRLVGESIRTSARIKGFAFRPGGRTIVTADSEGVVQQWDLATRAPVGPAMLGHTGSVNTVAFSPDGRLLASGGVDQEVRLWDFTVRQPLGSPLTGHARAVNSVAFSPDGKFMATGGFDTTTRLWNLATRGQVGRPLSPDNEVLDANRTLSPDPVTEVVFSHDGRLVVARSSEAVRFWDARAHRLAAVLPGDTRSPDAVAVSPGGRLLATADRDSGVRLWDAATRAPRPDPLPGSRGAEGVAFSPDGRRIAAGRGGGLDGWVGVWDVATGRQVARGKLGNFERARAVAFGPDGETLATAGGPFTKGARLWRLDGNKLRGRALRYDTQVNAVAFSRDGGLLATASGDQTVRLWSVATGQPFADPLALHTNQVKGVAFSPDGDLLASASDDGTARLWAAPRTWVRQACELAGRNLTRAEWDRYVPGKPYIRDCPRYPSGHGADPRAPAASYPVP